MPAGIPCPVRTSPGAMPAPPPERSTSRMYRVRQQDLPFQGSSHQFVGADNGDVNVSVFLLSALPGRGPGPHRHPYDEDIRSEEHTSELQSRPHLVCRLLLEKKKK